MATALNQAPRKRTSYGQEKDADRVSGKRRKEYVVSKDERKKRSKSSKKDTKSNRSSGKQSKSDSKATPPGLRVRSVTELAALVASGAIRVPKSLQHYMSDRVELLDQVFTILSPAEVEEMVPNVLKGLKMRQLKHSCLLNLQNMSEEEILSIVQPGGSSMESTLDSTLMGILGQSESSTPRDSNVQPVTPADKDVINTTEAGDTGATSVCSSSHSIVERNSVTDKEPQRGGGHSNQVSMREHGDIQDEETAISVSDVSEDDCKDKNSKPDDKLATSGGAEALPTGSDLSTDFEHVVEKPSVDPCNLDSNCSSLFNTNSDPSTQSGFKVDSSDSETEEMAKDLSKAGRLLEMEMRRRALESALRRVNEPAVGHEPTDEESQLYSGQQCESVAQHLSQPLSQLSQDGDQSQSLKSLVMDSDSKKLLGGNSEEVLVNYKQDGSSPNEELFVESLSPVSSDNQQLLIERRLREKLLRSLSEHK